MAIFYEDPDGVQYQRRTFKNPPTPGRAFSRVWQINETLIAWGMYDDAPDGAFYRPRSFSPPPVARRAWSQAYRAMESLAAADAWNADPAGWLYAKGRVPVPPSPVPFDFALIPTILNLGQLQLQLNTLFTAVINQLPEVGAVLPASTGYFDGKIYTVASTNFVYEVKNGLWVRIV